MTTKSNPPPAPGLNRNLAPDPDALPMVQPHQQFVYDPETRKASRPPQPAQPGAQQLPPQQIRPPAMVAHPDPPARQPGQPIIYDPERRGVGSAGAGQGLMWLPPPEEQQVRARAVPQTPTPQHIRDLPGPTPEERTRQGQPPMQLPQAAPSAIAATDTQPAARQPAPPRSRSLVPEDLMGDAPIEKPEPPPKRAVLPILLLVFGALLALAMVAAAGIVVVKKVVLDKKPSSSAVIAVSGNEEAGQEGVEPESAEVEEAADPEKAAVAEPEEAPEPPAEPPPVEQPAPPVEEQESAPAKKPSTTQKKPSATKVDKPPVKEVIAPPATTKPPPSNANLPDSLTKEQIKAACKAVESKLGACGQGLKGLATVSMKVSGNGKVTSATVVGGSFKGQPQASCIEKKVKGAKFPKFKQPSTSFSYPFIVK
jgi:hypothetical protein